MANATFEKFSYRGPETLRHLSGPMGDLRALYWPFFGSARGVVSQMTKLQKSVVKLNQLLIEYNIGHYIEITLDHTF